MISQRIVLAVLGWIAAGGILWGHQADPAGTTSPSSAQQRSVPLPSIPQVQLEQFQTDVAQQVGEALAEVRRQPQNATANGILGMMLHAYGLDEAAILLYERARAFAPTAFEWPYYQSYALASTGDTEEAIKTIKTALSIRPDHLPAQVKLGWFLFESGDGPGSAEQFRRAIDLDPTRGEAHYGLGRVLLNEQQVSEAVIHLKKSVELGKDNADVHYALMNSYRQLGEPDAAQEELALFQALSGIPAPGNSPLPLPVVSLNLTMDIPRPTAESPPDATDTNLKASIKELEEQLAQTEDPFLHARLMVLYTQTGDYEAAARHYAGARLPMRGDYLLHFSAGNMFIRAGEYERAREAFLAVLRVQPSELRAHRQIGLAFDLEGQGSKAIAEYRRVLEMDPEDTVTPQLLGRRLAIAGDFQGALAQFDPEPQSSPAWVLYARAMLLRESGQQGQARILLEQAAEEAQATGDEEVAALIRERE